jgi:hypothetical protein
MMRFFILVVLMIAMPSLAQACKLQGPTDDMTPASVAEETLKKEPWEFFGLVQIESVLKQENGQATYEGKVLSQYGGEKRTSVTLVSNGKSNCTFEAEKGEKLFIKIQKGNMHPFEVTLINSYFYGMETDAMRDHLDYITKARPAK